MTVDDKYQIIERKLNNAIQGVLIDAEVLCNELAEQYCGARCEALPESKVVTGVLCDFKVAKHHVFNGCIEIVGTISVDGEEGRVDVPLPRIKIIEK